MKTYLKRVHFLFLFYLVAEQTIAQNDSSQLTISYKVHHIIDTRSKKAIDYIQLLYTGTRYSYCISRNQEQVDSFNLAIKNQVNETGGGVIHGENAPARISAFESPVIYYDKLLEEFREFNSILFNKYEIRDTQTGIAWKLLDSISVIMQYRCQLAEANYKGRKWIVWFCPDIPLQAGPWKLRGLPGLIIKAGDDAMQVSFEMISMDTDNPPWPILFPEGKPDVVSRIKFLTLLKAYAQDPGGTFSNQTGARMSDIGILGIQKLQMPDNPIELSD